jgi:NADPH2:quinone reductase
VLIAVGAAGVGSWDVEMRQGWWPEGEPTFPLVLGTDGAGRVVKVGSQVRRLKVDDWVYSYSFTNPKGGFHAEYVAVVEERVGHLPKGLDLEQAGGMATTGLTALQGIDDALHLQKGEKILIHGASGGVGTLAVQFAKLRGARVTASGSGQEGVELAVKLEADGAVDGKQKDLAAAVRRHAGGPLDAILALVGGPTLDHAAETLRPGGRLAYPNGVQEEPKQRPGIEVISYDAVSSVAAFERLNHAVEQGRLKVPIAAVFPLADASRAHTRLEAGKVLGKIVLRVT